jgi:chromosome segregation protein
VYLKSLTMKGFKSFADPTTLDLETGVTVVVGPNGSGKSNVVDAVAWVLGAQGPSTVRSQKMDDVIFSGTASRPALGRAEVTLVIDNTSRQLPADLNEVTIRRTIFRNGDSEYALNGVECRLLDVQELLSDGGVGRQQHTIISQGQLDTILSARPEDRRVVIEEAAGIVKYRRRRERALRRLEAAEGSLVRLGDLLREVRRQIRPLERQAASAERHGTIAEELRAVTLTLAAGEIRALRLECAEARAALGSLDNERRGAEERVATLAGSIAAAEERIGSDPADRLVPVRARIDRLEERLRGIAAVLAARERSRAALAVALDEAAGVASLAATRDRLLAELDGTTALGTEIGSEWQELARSESHLVEAEALHAGATPDLAHGASEIAAVKRAEMQRRLEARELATRQRLAAAERLDAITLRRRALGERSAHALAALDALAPRLAAAAADLPTLSAAVEHAETAVQSAAAELAGLREERAALAGRVEALELALDEVRSRAGTERLEDRTGVLGPLAELVELDAGTELAFAAAVHEALDAIVCADEAAARRAVEALRGAHAPGSVLVARRGSPPSPPRPPAPDRAEWLADRVRARHESVAELLFDLTAGVVLTNGDLDVALRCLGADGVRAVVTVEGDVFSSARWRIGAGRTGATLDALERARDALEASRAALRTAEDALARAEGEREEARSRLAAITAEVATLERERARAERDATEAAALGEALETEEAAAAEVLAEVDREIEALDLDLLRERDELAEAEAAAEAEEERAAAARAARADLDERARALAALRRDLEVRTAALEERRGQLGARVAELGAEIDRREAAIADAGTRRDALVTEQRALEGLGIELERSRRELEDTTARVAAEFDDRRRRAVDEIERITAWRSERDDITQRIEAIRTEQQRREIELAQFTVREEAAADALRRDLDISPEEALAAPSAELPPGVSAASRRSALERELRELGPVNLLALEELASLQERSGFLDGQIADAQNARRELNGVIRAVDAEISGIFAAAFADVARNFELLVSTLFPGGTGRLSLTAPDDLLETGVEIEARPAGRTIRRLSLLSGGERSLVALAFLFAVFRSRPSPFYLMDEVEAALDEVNLMRFLALLEEFRDEAQLVVVSHQKRTMEIADALYGVTMQPGGASKVVSERLRTNPPGGRRAPV